ncbi:hypothetical protein PFZ55_16295 [Streptomyces sp. MS2A]|nr:hypothetical protein [Streptomyces sp. MS2A]
MAVVVLDASRWLDEIVRHLDAADDLTRQERKAVSVLAAARSRSARRPHHVADEPEVDAVGRERGSCPAARWLECGDTTRWGGRVTSVVFVHGTGVREDSYRKSYNRVATGLKRLRPDVRLVPCYWGDRYGAHLAFDGACFPERDQDRALPTADADDPLAVWGLLERDPVAEIELLADSAEEDDGGFVPGRTDPWDVLAARLRCLTEEDLAPGGSAASASTRSLAAELAPYLRQAAEEISAEISMRLSGTAPVPDSEAMAARAVIVLTTRLAEAAEDAEEPLPVDGADRDRLVALLTDRLGGTDRGIKDAGKWVGARLLGDPLLWTVSPAVQAGRRRVTRGVLPESGDILRYQGRGEGLRSRIAEVVALTREQDDGPVVLLAHSLGGVASFDLLALEPSHGVDLLITVGSQAPFLYEIDALAGLRRGDALPLGFPRWLNVYDGRDLLGFVGERIFPGRVTDARVDLRQPFPRAHTGYFAHDSFYERVGAELP